MSTDRQRHFREESDRRFGALDNYVDGKIEDEFPILGNLKIAQYVGDFLEFLFKRWMIKNLSPEDRKFLDTDGADTAVARYLTSWRADNFELSAHNVVSLVGCTHEEVMRKIAALEARRCVEGRAADIRGRILAERSDFFQKIPEVRVMEIGPAIGAISTMLVLDVLDKYEIADRAKIVSVDVSPRVLAQNMRGQFFYREDFVRAVFGSVERFERLKNIFLSKVSSLCCAADDRIHLSDDWADVSVASFLFHHIPHEGKVRAASEITRVTRGAVFVADEYFEDYKGQFGDRHKDDLVPLAPEEPVSMVDSIDLVTQGLIGRIFEKCGEHAYAYWGLKKKPAEYGRHFF